MNRQYGINIYPLAYDETNIEAAAAIINEIASAIRPKPIIPNIGTFAACRFCGQIIAMADETSLSFRNIEDAVEYATMHCDCGEAKKYRSEKYQKEQAEQKRMYDLLDAESAIDMLLSMNSGTPYICGPASKKIKEKILMDATLVYDHEIKNASTSIDSNTKIVISFTSKGKLKIEKKDNDTNQMEIG